MKTSEQTDKIFPAFIKAQGEFNKAQKQANAHYGKYANLDSYISGSAEGLKNNGLAILQDTYGPEDKQIINVKTTVIHNSGQWIESEPLVLHPADMKPMSFGSAQTYGRRYSMSSFLGMTATDDDGLAASTPPKPPKRASVNKVLSVMEELQEFTEYAKAFSSDYGPIWENLSGNGGNKKETWGQLFKTHKDRIEKVPPVNANQSPDDLQKEWETTASTCQDKETLEMLEKQVDLNKALQTDSNFKVLESLHMAYD